MKLDEAIKLARELAANPYGDDGYDERAQVLARAVVKQVTRSIQPQPPALTTRL